MWKCTVYAPFAQSVNVGLCAVADFFVTDITSPKGCISQEETLICSETVGIGQRSILCCVLVSCERNVQTTMVGNVFAQSQLTIAKQAWKHFNLIEEVNHHLSTLREKLSIFWLPPVLHVTHLVVTAALVVESVSHFMTDNHTDSTIVESIVSIHIEERILKDGCWETDFVSSRIIVSIDNLRAHQPFVTVNRLTQTAVHIVG